MTESPVKVDIALKANIDLPIPADATGGLINALTDAIRPFTERQGLKADIIRLQRMDVAVEIAKRGQALSEVIGKPIQAVPNKLLVPFLEKASLEDGDAAMRDYWAALLVSAATEYHSYHLTFMDLMSRLSSRELQFLEEICLSHKNFPDVTYPFRYPEYNERVISQHEDILNSEDGLSPRKKAEKFVDGCDLIYGRIIHVAVSNDFNRLSRETIQKEKRTSTEYFYPPLGMGDIKALPILEREGLIELHARQPFVTDTEIGYFNLTSLGVEFVAHCSPKALLRPANTDKEISF